MTDNLKPAFLVSSPRDVIFVILVGLVVYFLGDLLYHITVHPLAAIPGPILCGISRIPYWIACIRGQDIFWLHRLHQTYGPAVRFGPRDVSYATAEAWKPVYGPVKHKRENEKAQEFFVPSYKVPSMLAADYEVHSRYRRLFAPAFSERALHKHQGLIRKYIALFITKISELSKDGHPVEMTSLFNFVTFDIMAELCFGHELQQLRANHYDPWVRSIFEQLRALPFMSAIMYYPILNYMFSRFAPGWIQEHRNAHCQFAADLVDTRIREGPSTYDADLWRLAIDGLSIEEMHSNAEFFMIAGSETSATLLSGVVFYLLKNPQTMERLSREIRDSFQRIEEMSFEDLARLPYLNACLKEAMRIFPPVAVGSPRVVYEGGQHIMNHWLPGGTRISVHHYSTYRSLNNFKNPDEFIPDRWLGDPLYSDDMREAHQPFSYGPRDCLGQAFAKHEIRMVLAALVFTFNLELCRESIDWDKKLRCYALWEKGSIACRLSRYIHHGRL
ncbi:cytochrome P450 [Xylariaceae sp. FL1651]|nr:cytochrome P450 [Xylariaceae sp. FL1651]